MKNSSLFYFLFVLFLLSSLNCIHSQHSFYHENQKQTQLNNFHGEQNQTPDLNIKVITSLQNTTRQSENERIRVDKKYYHQNDEYIYYKNKKLKSYYNAAVAELSPNPMAKPSHRQPYSRKEASSIMHQNLDKFHQFLDLAHQKTDGDLDIIVFPEYGLNGPGAATKERMEPFSEDIPNKGFNPCLYYSKKNNNLESYKNNTDIPIIIKASCMARNYSTTIVIDMADQKHQNDQILLYNTLVAFGDDGKIIARYHKNNLYFEPEFTAPKEPTPVYFDTSFGVRFGCLVCFDIMFDSPQNQLFQHYNITDFVFPSWWVNIPPIIIGTETQQSHSLTFKSNLIAASSGYSPSTSGSGIYSQGEALTSYTNPSSNFLNHSNTLLIASVPKQQSQQYQKQQQQQQENQKQKSQPSHYHNSIDNSIFSQSNKIIPHNFDSTIIKSKAFNASTRGKGSITLDGRGLKCYLEYKIEQSAPNSVEQFALLLFNGNYRDLFPLRMCSLVRCKQGKDCSSMNPEVTESKTYFNYFNLRGIGFTENTHIYPMVTLTNNTIINEASKYWSYYKTSNSLTAQIQSQNRLIDDPLLGVTLWGVEWKK